MTTIPISEVRQAALAAGSHWFGKAEISFFRSRLPRKAYQGRDGKRYFVSSEQFVPTTGQPFPRRYTVRVQDVSGHVETVGDFQEWSFSKSATARAKHLASKTNKQGVK